MELKVKGITYFETRRGVGYNAHTNIKHIHILNDGLGGETYLYNYGIMSEIYKKLDKDLDECELESLIDDFELGGNDIDLKNQEYRMYN